MCGIFGIVGSKIDDAHLKKATDLLAHRGPNDSGFFIEDGVGLSHRWLSIIDLEVGHQPMYKGEISLLLVFYREINIPRVVCAARFKNLNRFKTRSKTEVIRNTYKDMC